jgi:hypothetical protein
MAALAQRHMGGTMGPSRELPTLGFTRKNNHLAPLSSSGTRGGVPLQYRAFATGPLGGRPGGLTNLIDFSKDYKRTIR